jgi:lipoprotein NlpI
VTAADILNLTRRLAAAALLIAAGAAQAQAPDDAERCASITGNPDLAIQHCTRAIESGKFKGEPLARLHYFRGIEWSIKNDHDRAIADYDAAIKLLPRFPDALYNRGNAWGQKGESDRAIADYDAAIKLAPKDAAMVAARAGEWIAKGDFARAVADYDTAVGLDAKSANALFGRGRARFYGGDFQRAARDMEQAFKLEPSEYTSLWLYLARKRGGAGDAEEALDRETRVTRGGWPAPVIVLFLGRTDPDSVYASATDPDARRQREQRCEANYYLAQWHLLRNDRERAQALLKEARSGCPRDFLEFEGAAAELRRLEK